MKYVDEIFKNLEKNSTYKKFRRLERSLLKRNIVIAEKFIAKHKLLKLDIKQVSNEYIVRLQV
ncbi:MAG: hypothetical protein ACI9TK_001079 [Flavobacteriaceae bacterium]|jgi:hypothetical protein